MISRSGIARVLKKTIVTRVRDFMCINWRERYLIPLRSLSQVQQPSVITSKIRGVVVEKMVS